MSRIIFSTHALERAEQRLFPGLSPNRIERLLQEAWSRGPAKLRHGKADEERWLISEPEAILVCAAEKGRRVCKTILFRTRAAPDTFEAEEETPIVRGRLVISLDVEYERRGLASHIDVEDALQRLVEGAIKGRINTKEYKVLKHKTTTRIECALSVPAPEAKTEG